MLKNLGYFGAYHDPSISVGVLLENPLHCGMESSKLVFSVTVKDSRSRTKGCGFKDCTFYIMDEQNHIYNAGKAPGTQPNIETTEAEEESCRPAGLIFTDFRPEFLFQNLRIAVYFEGEGQLHLIELRH